MNRDLLQWICFAVLAVNAIVTIMRLSRIESILRTRFTRKVG